MPRDPVVAGDGTILTVAHRPRARRRRDRGRQRPDPPPRRHERRAADAERLPHLRLRQLTRRRCASSRARSRCSTTPTADSAYRPAARRQSDRGLGDEIHGEAGDDTVYGMTGNDVIYGEARTTTSSAATATTGSRAAPATTASSATTAGSRRAATAPRTGWTPRRRGSRAPRTAPPASASRCTASSPSSPPTPTRARAGRRPERDHLHSGPHPGGDHQRRRGAQQDRQPHPVLRRPVGDLDPLYAAGGYDDIIFGGLGDDAIHGGVGDDAMTGAEAPAGVVRPELTRRRGRQDIPLDDCVTASSGSTSGTRTTPATPAALPRRHDGWHSTTAPGRAGEVRSYDEYDPRRAILSPRPERSGVHGQYSRRSQLPELGERHPHAPVLPQQRDHRGAGHRRLRLRFANKSTASRFAEPGATATTRSSATSATTGSSAAPAATPVRRLGQRPPERRRRPHDQHGKAAADHWPTTRPTRTRPTRTARTAGPGGTS